MCHTFISIFHRDFLRLCVFSTGTLFNSSFFDNLLTLSHHVQQDLVARRDQAG